MERKIIRERLALLRKNMKEKGIDALYIPTSDFHGSEYAGGYFRCREFFSGFTGSAGTLVVLDNQAGLWTDGRYFLQAEEQLRDTGITLYKMKEEGVPSVRDFLETALKEGQSLGVDGRTISSGEMKGFAKILERKGIKLCIEQDLAGTVWEQAGSRPELSAEPVWELPECYSGQPRAEKLNEIRAVMEKQRADWLLISSLDDIAWLFNLRGNDIPCVPVFLSYALIGKEQAKLYVIGQGQGFSAELKEKLEKEQIFLHPYEEIYTDLTKLKEKQTLWFDQVCTNAALVQKIPEHCVLIRKKLPTVGMKAVKNAVEIENERKAHLYDGIAFCKFLYWLKQQDLDALEENEALTEISAAEKLETFRKQQKSYLMPSFEPISGYAGHGAIVHYSATRESNAVLHRENFLLMDTGAHYFEGTTDITRTIALGKLTEQQKRHYTAVLCGNLRLGAAKFPYGACGVNIDILAREPLWELGLDYKHGTGHGVGYLLNVHEGPNNIRSEINARNSSVPLEEGMITSNEPGVYLAGEYGIRLENMILCKKAEKTEYGQFMEFETLTLVPFEREAVLPEMLDSRERKLLNDYHRRVYEEISPYLNQEEAAWLREAVKEI